MGFIEFPGDTGDVSDGYHTFDELYEHRNMLFLQLMTAHQDKAWFSRRHYDGSMYDGFFIAGITIPVNIDITYHMPECLYSRAQITGAEELENAPEWDGHTPNDVLARLTTWMPKNLGKLPNFS